MTDAAPIQDGPAATGATLLGHPRGLAYLAFTEAWERFSFYGMQTLLVLYMVSQLLLPGHVENVAGFASLRERLETLGGPMSVQALASAIFGIYAGAVYLTPILGGLLADRWLGRRRTVILGAVLMAAGHFMMAFEQPFLLALLCLVAGAGCFKGNIASQVGGLYREGDPKRADAFQIFYLAINAGAIAAPLVCGTLGERVGWHYGFGVAGAGVLVGLAIYLAGGRHLPPDPPRPAARATVRPSLSGREWSTLALLVGLLPVFAVALLGNQQVGNAYLVWARDATDIVLFGQPMPVTWLFTLDTVATVVCLSGSVVAWRLWARWRPEPDDLTKIVLGSASFATALLMLAAGAALAGEGNVAFGWLLAFHFLNNLGFANVLPVALALYTRAAPPSLGGTIIGIYYLQLVIANLLAGWLGGLLDKLSAAQFWGLHAALVAIATVVLLLVRILFGGLLASCPGANDA